MPTPWLTPEMEERTMRWRRRACVYGLAMMVPFAAEDLVSGGNKAPLLISIKTALALVIGLIGLALPHVSKRTREYMVGLLMFSCGLGMSAMAFLRGDHHTARFAWLLAMPLCLVVFARHEIVSAIIGCVTSSIGASAIILTSRVDLTETSQWLSCVIGICTLAIYASFRQRAHLIEEHQQSTARLQMLDRLSESEKRRSQAERMAIVGQLAAGVAHEVNNPLGFVMANLSFLEDELAEQTLDPAERAEVIRETKLGLNRIKDIVGDLTAFSREGAEGTTEVDLHEVVSEAERLATARTKGRIGVLNELPLNVRHVIANRRHLAQVFLNLILNAADAVGSQRSDGKIWIRATQVGAGLQVEVDDNGAGIPEAVLPSLFQPFFTTKAPGKGTGLGLATSREYMRQAGGDLHAMPRPGGGARFTLAMRCPS